jgi:hypothetical protein
LFYLMNYTITSAFKVSKILRLFLKPFFAVVF